LLDSIPDRYGKHAAQSLHTLDPPALEGPQDDFSIGMGAEKPFTQFVPQLDVVIDLTVVDDGVTPVITVHWLRASFQVDN